MDHDRQDVSTPATRRTSSRPAARPLNKSGGGGHLGAVARARNVAGLSIPGIVVLFFWVVVVILAIILLAAIVHWAGGGALNLRLGHFFLNVQG
jgi:hypothetical protein